FTGSVRFFYARRKKLALIATSSSHKNFPTGVRPPKRNVFVANQRSDPGWEIFNFLLCAEANRSILNSALRWLHCIANLAMSIKGALP
ncbi:hypothetical protein LXA47_25825, partial [Massilia sp. P8910]|uniref:hypothetical protein n=1 Tax=Massilia antarctica TaxID=2765360 RepID=UPI001E5ED9F6